jgi:hypothetical protein
MPQHQNLRILRRVGSGTQRKPAEHTHQPQIQQLDDHEWRSCSTRSAATTHRKDQLSTHGTVLGTHRPRSRAVQHRLRLREHAKDFPADGPVLIVTDGDCDTLRVRREHDYLIPARASLPFTAKGPIFRIS